MGLSRESRGDELIDYVIDYPDGRRKRNTIGSASLDEARIGKRDGRDSGRRSLKMYAGEIRAWDEKEPGKPRAITKRSLWGDW